jgi:hypothetical protein
VRRIALVAAMSVVHAITAVAPASAGGSHLMPVRDRYEVGETATLVGYTSGGQLGWLPDGPFYAYLVAGDATLWSDHRLPIDNVALGPLSVEAKGRTLRASISFPVPDHLVPGLYTVTYCSDPCTTGLGDLIGGLLAVGVDPPRQLQREWPLDDPEIANLAADAILSGPNYRVTAGDVQAGRFVRPPSPGPVSGQTLALDERPAPPPTDPQVHVSPLATPVLQGPVAQPTERALPGESPDYRPLGMVLVLMTSVIAIGAMGLRRARFRSVESNRVHEGAGTMASDPCQAERSHEGCEDIGICVVPR